VVWGQEPGFGLGNLELDARWTLTDAAPGGHAWRAALVARAGLPTGTGPFDARGAALGIQGVAARGLGRAVDLYLGAGGTVSNEDDGGGIDHDLTRLHGFLALEWRVARRWSLLAETTAASRLVTNLDGYPAVQSYLRLGAKLDLSPRWAPGDGLHGEPGGPAGHHRLRHLLRARPALLIGDLFRRF
jgi:hypothetical protein